MVTQVWAVYSVFDASYANRRSFGFFVDVGNGFTTLLPTLAFWVGMTAHAGAGASSSEVLGLSARSLGVLGMASFWQEFYGTCVYFFSFVINKRHEALTGFELGVFVCFTNGLWFALPLVGMVASWGLIQTNSFSVFL